MLASGKHVVVQTHSMPYVYMCTCMYAFVRVHVWCVCMCLCVLCMCADVCVYVTVYAKTRHLSKILIFEFLPAFSLCIIDTSS